MSDKLITYDKHLPESEVWAKLNESSRSEFQERDFRIRKAEAGEIIAGAITAYELLGMSKFLEGSYGQKDRGTRAYLTYRYGKNTSKGWQKLKQAREMEKKYGLRLFQYFVEHGESMLHSMSMSGISMGEMLNVKLALPPPKHPTDEQAEKFFVAGVLPPIKEGRVDRAKKNRRSKITIEEAEIGAFRAWDTLTSKVGQMTTAEWNKSIGKLAGWMKEHKAAGDKITVERESIPPGVKAQVGRPRKERMNLGSSVASTSSPVT